MRSTYFPSLSPQGHDADERDASPNPPQELMTSCLTERCQKDSGGEKKKVLFIKRACEATNEA